MDDNLKSDGVSEHSSDKWNLWKLERHLIPKPTASIANKNGVQQGNLCVQKAGGGVRLPLRAHLFICMFLHRSRVWSLSSFLEENV